MIRFPSMADIVGGQRAYKRTGAQEVKDSVQRVPAMPAQPGGVQRLLAEIDANTQRQNTIGADLAQLEAEYAAAALRWDVAGELVARVAMNDAAAGRRALKAELVELADDATRLQARLAAAQAAHRRAEHDADLARLERLCDEYAPILAEYKLTAVHLVALADELQRRRGELRSLRTRIVQYADSHGLDKPARDVSGETVIPQFFDSWLSGAGGSLAAVRRAMGVENDTV